MTPVPPSCRLVIGIVVWAFIAHVAFAATHAVTTLNDSGAGSLRDAITQANSAGGDDDIVFAGGVSGVIFLQSPLPNLSTNINIQGPGARILAVNGGGSRVFSCTGGTSTISGLTIAFGRVDLAASAGATAAGGGIFNQATLTLRQCAIKYNSVRGGGGVTGAKNGGQGNGGGVYNSGVLALEGCTLSGNVASGGGGAAGSQGGEGGNGGAGNGGAIFNNAGATMTLTNCTVSGNTAAGGPGGSGNRGAAGGNGGAGYGGIYGNGTLTVTASTVSGNTGTGGAGGAPNGTAGAVTGGVRNQGSATVRNLISAGNTGGDVSGTFISQGYNLIGPLGTATGFPATGDQTGVTNPNLGPLQNNDGPTDTMGLAMNSPAFDKGKSFGVPFDQRGHLRLADSLSTANATAGDGTDIGAFEFHPLRGAVNECEGMSDEFESFYAVNNPKADTDGDGMTDAQEYEAGTNPRDAKSNLRIIAAAKSGNDFTLTFSLAVVGKAYRLERKLNLTDATWQSAGVPILTPDTSGPAQLTDPNAISLGKAFYRPCTPGAPGCGWQTNEMNTFNQTAWGDSTGTAANILVAGFDGVYPSDLIVGGTNTIRFTGAAFIFNFLPAFSTAGVLTSSLQDPQSSPAGELGGEVLALQFNTDFSALLGQSVPLASLRICNLTALPALNGQTVAQFQATANHILGGGSATIGPTQAAAVARVINDAFLDGTPSTFAQENLFVGPCPCPP